MSISSKHSRLETPLPVTINNNGGVWLSDIKDIIPNTWRKKEISSNSLVKNDTEMVMNYMWPQRIVSLWPKASIILLQ